MLIGVLRFINSAVILVLPIRYSMLTLFVACFLLICRARFCDFSLSFSQENAARHDERPGSCHACVRRTQNQQAQSGRRGDRHDLRQHPMGPVDGPPAVRDRRLEIAQEARRQFWRQDRGQAFRRPIQTCWRIVRVDARFEGSQRFAISGTHDKLRLNFAPVYLVSVGPAPLVPRHVMLPDTRRTYGTLSYTQRRSNRHMCCAARCSVLIVAFWGVMLCQNWGFRQHPTHTECC